MHAAEQPANHTVVSYRPGGGFQNPTDKQRRLCLHAARLIGLIHALAGIGRRLADEDSYHTTARQSRAKKAKRNKWR